MRTPFRSGEIRTAVIGVAAGVIGGVAGALLVGLGGHSPPGPAPGGSSSETTHTQNVTLCTTYALIKASLRHPLTRGPDVLPAIAPLRLGLMENPDASPQVRDAIFEAVAAFDAILAKDARPHGLSEPPPYDQAAVDAALDQVWQVCGLGG